jgi:hypothetical protein
LRVSVDEKEVRDLEISVLSYRQALGWKGRVWRVFDGEKVWNLRNDKVSLIGAL